MVIWITDIEVFNDYFLAVFKQYNKEGYHHFEISKERNDYSELLSFFQSNICQFYPNLMSRNMIAGFNILGYDLIVLLDILLNHTTDNRKIQELSQYLLSDHYHTEEFKAKKRNIYSILYGGMKVLDVYKMYKWDDDSRRASLKWIAANMRMDNIVETPIPFNIPKTSREDRELILSYCKNDIAVVEEIIHRSKDMIRLRHAFRDTIQRTPGTVYSLSNTSLGYAIMTSDTKINKNKIQYNLSFKIKDILYPNISLHNKDFLDKIKEITINGESKIEYSYTLVNNDGSIVPCQIGMGGIHGCIENGTYEENQEYAIMDIDGTSYYPYQAIQYKLYPRSAGPSFVEKMEYLFKKRKELPKTDIRSKGYKEALNSVIGMSKLKGSSIYDHRYFYTITINGQFMLLSICEKIMDAFPEVKILYLNTDGFAIYYPRKQKQDILHLVHQICKEFRISPEFTDIKSFYILNVNNYISVIKDKKLSEEESKELLDKLPDNTYYYDVLTREHNIDIQHPPTAWYQQAYDEEGKLQWYRVKSKEKGILLSFHDLELHKDYSNFASKKAIYNYLLFNISVLQSITHNHDIFDFLFHMRRNKNTYYMMHPVIGDSGLTDPSQSREIDNKVLRYVNISRQNFKNIPEPYRPLCGTLVIGGKNGHRVADKKAPLQMLVLNADSYLKEHFHAFINFQYYIEEAIKILHEIERQNLFSLTS